MKHQQIRYMTNGEYLVRVHGKQEIKEFRQKGYYIIRRRDVPKLEIGHVVDTKNPEITAPLRPVFEAIERDMQKRYKRE